MSNFVPTCQLCGRPLDQPGDALSNNCGGDCWGCVGQLEADGGYEPSVRAVAAERASGLRPPLASQAQFVARGRAAIARSEAAGDFVPAEQVLARLQAKVDAAQARRAQEPGETP